MKKFKYLRISKTKKLRFIDNYFKKKLYIVFLHGFMSDIEGKKPQTFLRFAKKNKLGFLALEYSGHGKSSGEFIKGNISSWTRDTKLIIKKIVKKNNFILIGSSMGSWIGLNQFEYYKKQIKGVVIASQFEWNFTWSFNKGLLFINPPLGRALIEDALLRFLLKKDYELEAGNRYKFTISAKF